MPALTRGLIITTALMLLSMAGATAQQVTPTPNGGTVRVFSARDGLPSSNISQVVPVNDGYIWIATDAGIVRFNGYGFERVGEDYGVPEMRYIYYDGRRDELWFADTTSLVHYDGKGFRRYDSADGYRLPGSREATVSALLRDRSGALWIGSSAPDERTAFRGGLVRFADGTFTTLDTTAYPLDDITDLYETSDGTIWATSFGRTVGGERNVGAIPARYVPERAVFDPIDAAEGFPYVNTFQLVEDAHGSVWFFCMGATDSDGAMPARSGIVRYDGTRFQHFPEVEARLDPDTFVSDGFFDEESGRLYVAFAKAFVTGRSWTAREMEESVLSYRNGTWRQERLMSAAELERDLGASQEERDFFGYGFIRGTDGRIYGQPAAGFGQYTLWKPWYVLENGEWNFVDRTEQPLVPSALNRTWEWAFRAAIGNGGFALPSATGFGLFFPPRSRHITEDDGLSSDIIANVYIAPQTGHAWITHHRRSRYDQREADGRGLSVWDGTSIRPFSMKDGLSSNIVLDGLHQDRKGRMWIPTSDGVTLAEERGGAFRFKAVPSSRQQPYWVDQILETPSGAVWAWNGYVEPGNDRRPHAPFFLGRFDGTRFISETASLPDSLLQQSHQMIQLALDHTGRLWLMGYFWDGVRPLAEVTAVVRVLEEERWKEVPEEWQMPREQITHVGSLSDSDYFIAGNDLYRFDGARFHSLSRANAAFGEIAPRLRLSTSIPFGDYDVVRRDTLFAAFSGRGILAVRGEEFSFFERSSGVSSVRAHRPFVTPSGNILFSSSTGALVYNGAVFQVIKDDLVSSGSVQQVAQDRAGNLLIVYVGRGMTVTRVDTTRMPLHIASLDAGGRSYLPSERPRLDHSSNSIRLQFAALDHYRPQSTVYSYRLEGFDPDWSKPDPQHGATYTNLAPGRYTFRVRAFSGGGVATEEAAYAFTIAPPWWRTWWAYAFYGMLFVSGVATVDRVQRRRLVQRERERARERELEQAREIEQAYHELKRTQAQLVQSEKMASLGQLTAGIAHEIKNPLNFINNFAGLLTELADELEEDLDRGLDVGALKAVLADVRMNARKVEEHGRRADGIVRSMLEHSRGSRGERQPVEVNRLVEEYLNLAYHGMRARQPDFNVTLERNYDEQVGDVDMIPQDMGRVLLNLFNNAFQATSEHSDQPTVSVSTRRRNEYIEIRVADNGPGIPENIREKIFEPFFTTKPAGLGTGLGLSLSYDIVTQGHGGTVDVEDAEPTGAVFVIRLPALLLSHRSLET